MLQTYPPALLAFTTDGVIRASSVSKAVSAGKIIAFARRQAGEDAARAQQEVDDLRTAAARDGYHQGVLDALSAFMPAVNSLREQHAVLAAGVAAQLDAALLAMSAAPDVVVPQIRAALAAHLCERNPDDIGVATLHVPQDQSALLDHLLEHPIEGLQVRPALRRCLLLEAGAFAWELDLAAALADDSQRGIDETLPVISEALAQMADAYATRVVSRLRQQAQCRGLTLLEQNR